MQPPRWFEHAIAKQWPLLWLLCCILLLGKIHVAAAAAIPAAAQQLQFLGFSADEQHCGFYFPSKKKRILVSTQTGKHLPNPTSWPHLRSVLYRFTGHTIKLAPKLTDDLSIDNQEKFLTVHPAGHFAQNGWGFSIFAKLHQGDLLSLGECLIYHEKTVSAQLQIYLSHSGTLAVSLCHFPHMPSQIVIGHTPKDNPIVTAQLGVHPYSQLVHQRSKQLFHQLHKAKTIHLVFEKYLGEF